MIFPSLDRVKAIAPGYDIVPVYMEILSDVRTPISVLKALKQVSSHTYLLEVRIIVIIGAVTPSWAMILRLSSSAKSIK